LIEIGKLVLDKNIFSINTCKYGFPYCGLSRPLEETWIYIISESFQVNLSSSGSVILRKFLNDLTPFL
jgi:hypothetical protein